MLIAQIVSTGSPHVLELPATYCFFSQRPVLSWKLINNMKMPDEILEELWKIKDSIAEEYAGDVRAFVAFLRTRKRGGEQQTVDLRGMKLIGEQGQPDAR